ncbi:MAG: DUF6114 domain-containing protein [Thermoplasmatales archaeon]|nr:DUF6114 domain-containing protein [Thermoplasmatales archaeon]
MEEESNFPRLAYLLSALSAFPIILGGLLLLINLYDVLPFSPAGSLSGILGLVWGTLILAFSYRLKIHPENHMLYGILISILSITSIYGGYWGFGVGLILGLMGGILAILWSPEEPEDGDSEVTEADENVQPESE